MEFTSLLAFIAVATLLVISPGPNGVLIAKTVPSAGVKPGFANVWGFVAAFYLHGTLSIFGISVILLQSAQAFTLFKLLGAAYLCWIGIKALLDAWQHKPSSANTITTRKVNDKKTLRFYFGEGFLTNALNPKVSMFYLAAFPQFINLEQGAISAYTLITTHALINFFWFSAMILMLGKLKLLGQNERFNQWLKSITGFVFIGFGLKLAALKSD